MVVKHWLFEIEFCYIVQAALELIMCPLRPKTCDALPHLLWARTIGEYHVIYSMFKALGSVLTATEITTYMRIYFGNLFSIYQS